MITSERLMFSSGLLSGTAAQHMQAIQAFRGTAKALLIAASGIPPGTAKERLLRAVLKPNELYIYVGLQRVRSVNSQPRTRVLTFGTRVRCMAGMERCRLQVGAARLRAIVGTTRIEI